MIRALKKSAVAVLFALVAACGGGSGGNDGGTPATGGNDGGTISGATSGATSGVLGTKRLPDLTDADRKAICDWTGSLYGGYGKSIDCGSSGGVSVTVSAPASQAECLARAALVPATCQATVAQSEVCVKAIADCDQSNDQTACAAMLTCIATAP